MIKEKLSSRQLIFSRNLASGMSQTDAAKGAGYSFARARITGDELLKKPKIKEEVSRTRQDIETALGIMLCRSIRFAVGNPQVRPRLSPWATRAVIVKGRPSKRSARGKSASCRIWRIRELLTR